jgi:nicotinamidase-related amidase
MPLTQLDPVAALIVIDLQKGIVGLAHSSAEIIDRSAQLARAFRQRNLPVILVNVIGAPAGRTDSGPRNFAFPPDFADLVPALDQQSSDILISKQCTGAFTGTTLDQALRNRGVTQVFITGISTSVGVESTARTAYDLGYNVVLVTDAMTDRDPDAHLNRIEKFFPRIAETCLTADALALLQQTSPQ